MISGAGLLSVHIDKIYHCSLVVGGGGGQEFSIWQYSHISHQ